MAVIVITYVGDGCGREIAAGIARRVGAKLLQQDQLEHEAAERLGTTKRAIRGLLRGRTPFSARWNGLGVCDVERCLAEQFLKRAIAGDIVVLLAEPFSSLPASNHVMRVLLVAATETRAARPRGCRQAHDLFLEIERGSSDEIIDKVSRLSCQPTYVTTAASRAEFERLLREVESVSHRRACARLDRCVSVGRDEIELGANESSEQAIARIERHWHGRTASARGLPVRLRPPDQM
jgi:hypothetical protein